MNQKNAQSSLSWLKLLSVLSLVVPVFLFLLFGAFTLFTGLEEADKRVSRSLRVAHEHASKVLNNAEALELRVGDLVEGRSAAELRVDEAGLHAKLKALAKNQPQLQSIWVIGADGFAIASSNFFPVPKVSYSDREYLAFHRQGKAPLFLSKPFASRTTGERVLDMSGRFNDGAGAFAGVINVSMGTSYFERFYADLVEDEPGLAVNLFRDDGEIYTRYPIVKGATTKLGATSPAMQAIAAGKTESLLRGTSTVDGEDRLIGYKKIDDYPIYLGTGMNLSTVRRERLIDLAGLFAFGFPPFLALFLTARYAVRRTREAFQSSEQLQLETRTRQKAEEALLQAQKLEALGRLTGGVAHDFNNALMVISNNAFLLRRNTNEAGAKQLSSIGRAVDSATKLTRQLLSFSRRQALVPERVQLQERLENFKDLVSPVLGSQIEVTTTVAATTAAVTVDPAELELALLNLAINARDAMPSGGRFSISVQNAGSALPRSMKGDFVMIAVEDSGSGIASELLEKVFEPFFTTKPIGHGTGLGLSQVYGFCKRAGGDAEIASTMGAGTVVRLFLPASGVPGGSTMRTTEQVNRDLGKTLLLVEDNDDVAASLLQILDALGCKAQRVSQADAARELLVNGEVPDLVLSDVVMPGDMNGLALARWLRSNLPNLPVILMTGYAEQIDAITEEGFEILPKPYSAQSLSVAIERACSSSASR